MQWWLLAQGIPFLHSGQEFARTKHGAGNTYNQGDAVNQINYQRRNDYREMQEHTKLLIRLRKEHPCFRYSITESLYQNVAFEEINGKALIYKAKDEKEELWSFFNPSPETLYYHLPQPSDILYYNGASTLRSQIDLEIQPYSTVICRLLEEE